MTEKTPAPKFAVGDHVIVRHPEVGDWMGYVLWRNYTDDESGWEYEVSNAPLWRASTEPGTRWHPLAWESELERVIRPAPEG